MTTQPLTSHSASAHAALHGGAGTNRPALRAAIVHGASRDGAVIAINPAGNPTGNPGGNPGGNPAAAPGAPQPWDAFDALDEGLALHDRPGRQVFANTAMQRLAEVGDGLQRSAGGAVLPTDPGALRLLQRALAAAAAGTAVELAVPRQSGAPPYLMRCTPVPGRSGWTVLRVADSAQRRAPSEVFLRSAFGLTQAEALLAIALCRGTCLSDYAAERGISIHTARTQLRALLGKTRTDRQADLVGMLSGLSF